MKHQWNNLSLLLCDAIHNKTSGDFSSFTDWETLMSFAGFLKVMPIAVEQAKSYESFLAVPSSGSYISIAVSATVNQIKQTLEFSHIYQAFVGAGVYPLVLKGIICRSLYGELADHRVSGDEDILIKKSQFRKVDEVLKSFGYLPDNENVTKKQMDALQEVTYVNPQNGFRVEVHFNAIGKGTELKRRMNSCFENVWDNCRKADINGTEFLTLSHTDHFLFLIFHALKHFTAGGLGIRQVMDIAMYRKSFENEINWTYIDQKLAELSAQSFFEDMMFISKKYLGFEFDVKYETECPEELLDDILESGIYGNDTQARRTATNMVVASTDIKNGNKLTLLFKTVFPGKNQMLFDTPEIQDKPWLILKAYFKRIGRFISHSKEHKNTLASQSVEIGKKRISLIKKYNLK